MKEPSESDLRDRFAALRRADAPAVPSFTALRAAARARPRRPRRRLVPLAGAIAVLALGVLVALSVIRARPRREPLVSLAATRWQSPTDFLLRIPGAEYLEAVPRLTL